MKSHLKTHICSSCGLNYNRNFLNKNICSLCNSENRINPNIENISAALYLGYYNKPNLDKKRSFEDIFKKIKNNPYWLNKNISFSSELLHRLENYEKFIGLYNEFSQFQRGTFLKKKDLYFSAYPVHETYNLIQKITNNLNFTYNEKKENENNYEFIELQRKEQIKFEILNSHVYIPIVTPFFLSSRRTKFEFYIALEYQKPIFPIWSKEIDKEFLQQKELGIQILKTVGMNWKEYEDDYKIVSERISSYYKSVSLNMIKYNNVLLYEPEANFLSKLEELIGEKITYIKDENKYSEGFYIDDGHVIKLIISPSNSIKYLPKSISNLRKLIYFSISAKKLPETIGNLKNLKYFSCTNGNLKKIPNTIGNLLNLQILDLSFNKLSNLPSTINNLKNLKVLILNCNNFTALPSIILKIQSLEELEARFNNITNIESNILNLPLLQKLDLTCNKFNTFPSIICQISKLKKLYFGGNLLELLPNCFGDLQNLTELNLDANKLKYIPENIANLNNLSKIQLAFNQIKNIPDFFKNFSSLKEFYINSNKIESINSLLPLNNSIESINISRNQISTIPSDLSKFNALNTFIAEDNQITGISEKFLMLPCLRTGLFTNNVILNLPNNLNLYKRLSIFEANISKSTNLTSELKNLLKSRKLSRTQFKILMAGEGAVGKSSFIYSIANRGAKKNTRMTLGVNFTPINLNISGINITVQFWDFAGQEAFTFIRNSFIKGSCGIFYLYDLTRPKSLEGIDSWFFQCRSVEPDIPIILVGNKMDIENSNDKEKNTQLIENTVAKLELYDGIRTSALTLENLERAVYILMRKVLEDKKLL